MISVQNRLPEPGKENRVSITPDSGSPIEGVLAYADNASQQGTFWNRSTAQLLQGDIRTYPVREGQSISAGDVVNVGAASDGEAETVYKDVVAQSNVENTIITSKANDTAICVLSETDSIFAQCTNANYAVYLRKIDTKTGNYSGSTLTIGTGNGSKNVKLSKLDGDSCIIQYIDGSYLRANVVNSGNSLTNGTGKDIATSVTNTADLVALTQSSFVSFYNENGMKCVVSTVSGNVITLGSTEYPLSGNTGANYISACRLPDEGGNKRVCICFADTGDSNKGKAVIATINSSNAVTFGDVVTFESSERVISTSCDLINDHVNVSWLTNGYYLNMTSISSEGELGSPITVMENEISGYITSAVIGNRVVTSGRMTGEDKQVFTVVEDNNSTLQVVSSSLIAVDMRYPSATPIYDNRILYAYSNLNNSQYGTTTILTVEGNQIAGSFIDNSSDAIALADGTGGQSIPVGFGGYCECPGVTEGQKIISDGVSAFSPLDGWLSIADARDKQYVVGEYSGTGETSNEILLGFIPTVFEIFEINTADGMQPLFRFVAQKSSKIYSYTSVLACNVKYNEKSIVLSTTSGDPNNVANNSLNSYIYVAWR